MLVLLSIPLGAIGVQGYRVLNAIGEIQSAAVVPLPTRVPRTPVAVADQRAPTPVPTAAPTEPARDVAGSTGRWGPAAQTDDGTAGPAGVAAEPTPSTAPLQPTPTPPTAPAGGEAVAVAPGAISEGDDAGGDDTSALDVLRQLTDTGGDPANDDVWQGRDSVTILVLGVDRRPNGGDQNADVIIIARLNLETGEVYAVGIPRDLLVEIPGYGPGKINGAYNLGVQANPDDPVAGVVMMRDTVEDTFGVYIDHYLLVDFAGFEQVIDAVGGIDVTVPERIVDEAFPTIDGGTETVIFEPGPQHMDGARALQYARTRNADSDDERRDRQFQILYALFNEGRSLGSITNVVDVILALGGAVQTSLPLEAQLSLAQLGLDMTDDNIDLAGIEEPLVHPDWTEDGLWVYVGDQAELAAFVQETLHLPASLGAGG